MCLYHPAFSKLMRSADFMKNICLIAIDEAHCVSQWGDGFRKAFRELGRLRSYVPTSIPFLATSATLSALVLGDIQTRLHFSGPDTFLVNLGNHRANITNIFIPICTANNFSALNFLADDAHAGQPLKRTIIFFNTRDLAYKGSRYLKGLLPEARQCEIDFLHAGCSGQARRKALMDFRNRDINILCATEAAGMVRSSLLLTELNVLFLGHGYTRY
jgi:superfamily II DNA helicase RecQ